MHWASGAVAMTGQQVEVLVGHFIQHDLLARQSLSIFRAIYDFTRARYFWKGKLWDSVRCELWVAAAVLPLLQVDLSRSWSMVLTRTDASPGGWLVCHADTTE